jgi:uncharacterized membrane protein YdjX (TVP38/TMEM64 family)
MKHHHLRSATRRGIYSLVLVALVTGVGTVGIHYFEQMSFLDSFYVMSMIATAQGLAMTPSTSGGKIFIAFMSFISVGAVVASLGFLFGPFFGQLWHIGVNKVEEELHMKEKKK